MSTTYHFDEAAADRACRFFPRYLRHVEGDWKGQPFDLAPWQMEKIIRPLFGWKRDDNGRRRYRTVFVFVPRKNGKSALAAGVSAICTYADGEPGAQVYCAAGDRAQAGIVFGTAKKMIQSHKALRRQSKILKRTISIPRTGSFFQVLSADAGTKHGLNPHAVVIDELHVHKGPLEGSLFEALTTAQGARSQPVTLVLTTAGFDRKSIAYGEYKYACQVRDGVVKNEAYLPVIFEAGEKDDPGDPTTWARANPNLGISLYREYLEEKWSRALGSPATEGTFRRLHLNIWTEQATKWIPLDKWRACTDESIEIGDLIGRPCTGGLDLSTTEDISAFVLAFELDDGRILIVPFFWVPEETAHERERKERVPYMSWIADGLVQATEGNVIDYDVIRRDIGELGDMFDIREIAYDPWNATQIATQLEQDGFTCTKHPQNFRTMAEPTAEFQRLWKSAQLVHDGNEVLLYQAANVAVKQNTDGFLKPAKDISGDRIDGITAGVMAIGRLVLDIGGIDTPDEVMRIL